MRRSFGLTWCIHLTSRKPIPLFPAAACADNVSPSRLLLALHVRGDRVPTQYPRAYGAQDPASASRGRARDALRRVAPPLTGEGGRAKLSRNQRFVGVSFVGVGSSSAAPGGSACVSPETEVEERRPSACASISLPFRLRSAHFVAVSDRPELRQPLAQGRVGQRGRRHRVSLTRTRDPGGACRRRRNGQSTTEGIA